MLEREENTNCTNSTILFIIYVASDSLPHKYVGYFVSSENKKEIYK